MRIVQLLPTITPGDAVSNHALALRRILRRWDRKTAVYAENISPALPADTARDVSRIGRLRKEDVLIYHFSIGTPLHEYIETLKCRKVMIYHNVTPPEFLASFSPESARRCAVGLAELRRLRGCFDYCLPVSEFNRQSLLAAGYTCPMDVCPILIPFGDYDGAPDERILKRYGDGRTNILFVGRVVPNKRQEDVIRAFAAYQRLCDPTARLFLVGSAEGMERYREALFRYSRALGARNVKLTGSVSFPELLAYYRTAHIFACQSEHEGFCVPLLEAMRFDVPVAAYAAAAIPETLNGCGVLLEDKDPLRWAAVFRALREDEALRQRILSGQRRRLADFGTETVERRLVALLTDFLARPRAKKPPLVVQMAPAMSRGDAVSSHMLQLAGVLDSLPCRPLMWTLECEDALLEASVRRSGEPPALEKEDVAVFHMGMGEDMAERFAALKCRKVMVYHNVTPPEYLAPYSAPMAAACRRGIEQSARLAERAELCLPVSEFNRETLLSLCPGARTELLPILLPWSDYAREPEESTLRRLSDGRHNLLFVGRLAPNKRIEDVIRAFACYRTRYDADARLILAGSSEAVPGYTERLRGYLRALGEENVWITGKLSFPALLACYRRADVFLCLSEHEGFCVPLLEAMYFDVPVVARAAAAVPETLRGCGVLLPDGDAAAAAEAVHVLLTDEAHRAAVLAMQRSRLEDFSHERVFARSREIFAEVLGHAD